MNDMSPQEWIDHQLSQGEYISGQGVADIVNQHFTDETVGCEIGVCLGVTSEYYMKTIPSLKKLYCVDNYPEYVDWNGFVFDREKQDAMKNHAYQRLERFKDKIEFVYEYSYEFAKTVNEKTFDFIFIDGNHSYEGALRDFEAYYPLVKDNGIFAGHDFSISGVNKSLREYLKEDFNKIKQLKNNAWYLIK